MSPVRLELSALGLLGVVLVASNKRRWERIYFGSPKNGPEDHTE